LSALLGGAAGLVPVASLISVQPLDETGNPTPAWLLKVHVMLVVVALTAAADWPHRATRSQLQGDLQDYVTQVRADVLSCGVEVEETLSAYNQIMAGVSTDRNTAIGIADRAALDCTPAGNGTKGCVARSCDSSEHKPSTFALRPWLNMSPTIVMPPRIHCPPPPRSAWLNCAIVPLLFTSACSSAITASVLTE